VSSTTIPAHVDITMVSPGTPQPPPPMMYGTNKKQTYRHTFFPAATLGGPIYGGHHNYLCFCNTRVSVCKVQNPSHEQSQQRRRPLTDLSLE